MAVELGLLGEVTAHVDGRAVELGPARQRCVLAALAVDAGRVVPVERLMERVWGADTPRRGRATLHSHISRLRRALPPADGVQIVLRSGGYTLLMDGAEHAVDLHRFRDLCARARGTGDDAHAVALLTEAVALWRGEPLTGLSGQWVEAERDRLRQERLAAEHDLVDARLRVGGGEDLVAELSERAARYPLDERVAGQYLLALHRAGRSADALEHYRRLRDRLVDELGTDPGGELQQLHRRILAADSTLTAPPGGGVAEPVVVPQQLPAAPPHFTGRDTDLAALTATLDQVGLGRMVVISAIAGAGGIGKTWLAVHWAHQQRDRFPDGQLFVDLRGFSPDSAPMAPAVAVRGFLDALGVDPGRIPVDPQAQSGLFRSLVAHKRMLIVLDNAATAEQVRPMLPGGDSCTVAVTSRRTLTGLITRHGARHLTLDTLSDEEARVLLTRRLGAARIAAEPEAVEQLVGLCGGLPLALGIIAGRAHAHPRVPLATFAADLRGLGLGALEDDDPATSLPTVLSWSYRALTTQQQVVFGLLGAAPGPDIGLPAAASLTGLSPAQTARVLRGLEEASLLCRDAHGRYSMHDLIRRCATDTAHHQLPDDVRTAALRRVVDFYLHTAHTADRLLDPARDPIALTPPQPEVTPEDVPDHQHALTWFTTEHKVLIAAIDDAASAGFDTQCWQLAWLLFDFLDRQGHWHDQATVGRTALAAASRLADPAAQAHTHRYLARAYVQLERHDDAHTHLQRALILYSQASDKVGQAHTHLHLGILFDRQDLRAEAFHHDQQALDLYRVAGHRVGQAYALNSLGWSHLQLGHLEQALAACEKALTLLQELGHREGEAHTWDSLGYAHHHLGHHTQAITCYRHALDLFRQLGDRYGEATSLTRLGDTHHVAGNVPAARTAWQQALTILDQLHHPDADHVRTKLRCLDHPGPQSPGTQA